ncbi:MAG: metalloregulator ArsR/SmtB family transcription factor [Woeseiaceae bacterium]|nr:metalloregulator ArsR/SmtB family transcription factor [Woeseiaceae bacterium]
MNPATEQLMNRFKALADPVRLRLLALCAHGECSVSELTEIMGQSQPRVSQHLKKLCDSGLVERFRDGHFVYYRVPTRGSEGRTLRNLIDLLPADEPEFERDSERLRELRGSSAGIVDSDGDRALHRALVELTVSTPVGDLLDIGCGQGRLLKLLASRARRAVGIDIDADARRFARAHLLLAGLRNCTFRHGDMYALPLAERTFDTIIVDDVLGDADDPVRVLEEARRPLRDGGRIFVLNTTDARGATELASSVASWCREAGLRLTPPRSIPAQETRWLLAVATPAESASAAA